MPCSLLRHGFSPRLNDCQLINAEDRRVFLWGDAPANPDVPGVRLWAALNISPHAHGNPLIGPTVDTARMRLAARPGIVWYSACYQPELATNPRGRGFTPPSPRRLRQATPFSQNACQTEVPMPDVYQPDTPRTRGDRATPHISDAPHISPATMAEDAHTTMVSRISWGAVLAGVVVALVTQLLLNMLGIGIGAATLNP